jgi:hypothetical protein
MSFYSLINLKKPLFWFSCSLVIPLYFGIISTYYAFSQDYIVQDDVRQHVVWLQRFVNPPLFPNDIIADYFTSLAPVGYKFFYWTMAFGIEPIVLAKILPLFLAVIATIYIYKLSLKIFPVPASAFLTCWLFNQLIWLNDDLISATPRAFVYPLFAAFLYYLVERALIPLSIAIALQGLFYPQLLLVELAILTLRLFNCKGSYLRLSQEKTNYLFWLAGLGIAFLVLLPVVINKNEFYTLVTPAQMQVMPEFGWRGRNQYFGVNPLQFIFLGNSGIQIPLFPSIVWVGFTLPFLSKSRFPKLELITAEVKILWQVILASLGFFFLAHLLLPKLHLPSRYTLHSFRFVIAIAAGIVLFILLESGWNWWQHKRYIRSKITRRESLGLGLIGIGAAIVIIFPIVPPVFLGIFQTWVVGTEPTIYQFLIEQPKDILIASLASEADNLPAFAERSNFVGREYALAYHPAYYKQMEERAIAIIEAQYSSDLSVTQAIVKKYNIDFFLIEQDAFDADYLLRQEWLIRSSFKEKVIETNESLKKEVIPALKKLGDRCSVLSSKKFILVDANCLKNLKTLS